MKLDRVMIAAPASGSGKTTVTCALLQALQDAGEKVVAFKCGPDYIDPMFHRTVLGVPSRNLDTFFTDEKETRRLLTAGKEEAHLAVFEGVMGLYDGLGGVREEGSSYHLAKVTKTPIILVVDAKGMGRSVLALIAGFLSYDKDRLIKGVIFNRMSGAYYEMIRPLAEKELGIRVLGYIPRRKEELGSRHLGLVMPEEVPELKEKLERSAQEFRQSVSLADILEIAGTAEPLPEEPEAQKAVASDGPVIAVARDEAFCFYYEDNLRLLREAGARLAYFSPIRDEALPEGCSGILLGGGYPELYAEKLCRNEKMREAVRKAVERGVPTVAECGGFLYLHEAIVTGEGKRYPMAGLLTGTCTDAGRLVRFGYVEIREKEGDSWTGTGAVRGHEFHYYDSEDNGADCLATKPATGRKYPCIWKDESRWFGFPHLYYPSNPQFAVNFVRKAAAYRRKEEE